jgi:hypothetical protein
MKDTNINSSNAVVIHKYWLGLRFMFGHSMSLLLCITLASMSVVKEASRKENTVYRK